MPDATAMTEVVLLMGLPGAGKTRLLGPLRALAPGAVVDRDRIRPAMFPEPFDARREKDAANEAVWAAVAAHLAHGRRVYVDGMTFASQGNRDRAARIAAAHGGRTREILLDVPVALCRERVAAQTDHPSPERRPALVDEVAARFAPLAAEGLRLDGRLPTERLAEQAARWLLSG